MTADQKYYLRNDDSSRQIIQMQLSKKKTFSELFAPFLKYRVNFQHFEAKVHPPSLCLSKITDCQIPGSIKV